MTDIFSKIKNKNIKIYAVGGSIRDSLLGIPHKDIDYVVVGATEKDLIDVGLKKVGADFPCYIDPRSKLEYSLARTEKKISSGYYGFNCEFNPMVTLEDDLKRRDLTINAIAQDQNKKLIDPFQGLKDIENKILRHTSLAFSEDPLRVLRVARFAAKLKHLGFKVAPETKILMKKIANSGELQTLTPERIWLETEKALSEKHPEAYFSILKETDALKIIFPEIACLFGIPQPEKYHPEIDTGVHTLMVLQRATELSKSTVIRFSALVHDLGKGKTPKRILPSHKGHEKAGVSIIQNLGERLKIPKQYLELAKKVSEYHLHCHKVFELKPTTILNVIHKIDGFRKPELFKQFLMVCKADAQGRKGLEQQPYPQADYFLECLITCQHINIKALIANGLNGKALGKAIQQKRIEKITQIKSQHNKK